MRGELTQSKAETKLSSDELDALRVRLTSEQGENWDIRAHGATTVADVSEALGVPEETILEQLDRWRSEQAILAPKRMARSQKGLLGLAVVLFGVAVGVREIKINGDDWHQGLLYEESLLKKKMRGKSVHYPITNRLALGSDSPPFGFDMELRGLYTVTVASSGAGGKPESVDEATEQLAKALPAAVKAAKGFQDSAPKPSKPLPNTNFGMPPEPNVLSLQIGNTVQQVSIGPTQYDPTPKLSWNPADWKGTARSIVQGAWQSQKPNLTPDHNQSYPFQPPVGLPINFKGKRQNGFVTRQITVLPMDADAAKQAILYIRQCLARDAGPPDDFLPQNMKDLDAKKPIPPYSEVSIDGPVSKMTFKIPTGISDKYPTSVAAAKGAEEVLKQIQDWCLDQVKRANQGQWGH